MACMAAFCMTLARACLSRFGPADAFHACLLVFGKLTGPVRLMANDGATVNLCGHPYKKHGC